MKCKNWSRWPLALRAKRWWQLYVPLHVSTSCCEPTPKITIAEEIQLTLKSIGLETTVTCHDRLLAITAGFGIRLTTEGEGLMIIYAQQRRDCWTIWLEAPGSTIPELQYLSTCPRLEWPFRQPLGHIALIEQYIQHMQYWISETHRAVDFSL